MNRICIQCKCIRYTTQNMQNTERRVIDRYATTFVISKYYMEQPPLQATIKIEGLFRVLLWHIHKFCPAWHILSRLTYLVQVDTWADLCSGTSPPWPTRIVQLKSGQNMVELHLFLVTFPTRWENCQTWIYLDAFLTTLRWRLSLSVRTTLRATW